MNQDYQNDQALQEIHDEMYRVEEERPKSGFGTMDPKTKMMIAITAGVIIFLMVIDKITPKNGMIALGIGGLILFLMNSGNPKRQELTWLECMIRINDLLKFLQKHQIGDYPQVPRGEVRVSPIGRKQWYDGQPFKRSFKVDIYDKSKDVTEIYFCEVDVFTGDIITFRHAPEGVYGNETKDIRVLPSFDMTLNKKRDEFLGKGVRKQ